MNGEAAQALMDDVENRLSYHPVRDDGQAETYQHNRDAAIEFASLLITHAPGPSRELSLALTAVQEALMWANAAIACAPLPTRTVVTKPAHDINVGDTIHVRGKDRLIRSIEPGPNGFLYLGLSGIADLVQVGSATPVLVVVE